MAHIFKVFYDKPHLNEFFFISKYSFLTVEVNIKFIYIAIRRPEELKYDKSDIICTDRTCL